MELMGLVTDILMDLIIPIIIMGDKQLPGPLKKKKKKKTPELLTQAAVPAFVSSCDSKRGIRTSLGAQWVRICLPVKGTEV